jgi:signal peptidase II
MNPTRRRGALLVGVAAAVVALDQWSKSWAQQALKVGPRHVLGPMYLVLTYNRGAAFSFGTGASPVIAAVAVALVIAVALYSRRLARGGAPLPVMVALGLLAGGAVSNLADRFFRHHHGAVVDFISLVSWWATFNVADAAITVGALTLAVSLVFFPGRRAASATTGTPPVGTPPVGTGATRSPSGAGAAPGGNPDH